MSNKESFFVYGDFVVSGAIRELVVPVRNYWVRNASGKTYGVSGEELICMLYSNPDGDFINIDKAATGYFLRYETFPETCRSKTIHSIDFEENNCRIPMYAVNIYAMKTPNNNYVVGNSHCVMPDSRFVFSPATVPKRLQGFIMAAIWLRGFQGVYGRLYFDGRAGYPILSIFGDDEVGLPFGGSLGNREKNTGCPRILDSGLMKINYRD